MSAPTPAASAQFLRESEVRRGTELLFFGYSRLIRAVQAKLGDSQLGLAHFRALYWVGRHPDISVSELLAILGVTKQSLGRVLTDLTDRALIETKVGDRDRRQRLLRLTDAGVTLDSDLFEAAREVMGGAYAAAGQQAVTGFWSVLDALLPANERARIHAWRDTSVPPRTR